LLNALPEEETMMTPRWRRCAGLSLLAVPMAITLADLAAAQSQDHC
jgi:hypothetical protein